MSKHQWPTVRERVSRIGKSWVPGLMVMAVLLTACSAEIIAKFTGLVQTGSVVRIKDVVVTIESQGYEKVFPFDPSKVTKDGKYSIATGIDNKSVALVVVEFRDCDGNVLVDREADLSANAKTLEVDFGNVFEGKQLLACDTVPAAVASPPICDLTPENAQVSTVGTFENSSSVVAAKNGTLYTVDHANLARHTQDGRKEFVKSTIGAIAGDTTGNLYYYELDSQQIRKLTPSGADTMVAQAGDRGAAEDQFNRVVAMAAEGVGNVYVMDNHHISLNGTNTIWTNIRKITSTGTVSTLVSKPANEWQVGHVMAAAADGTVYVAGNAGGPIQVVSPTGALSTLPTSGTSFGQLGGIAVDGCGNLFVTETFSHRVFKISSAGVVTPLAGTGGQGSQEGKGAQATFSGPKGIAVEPSSGHVYVADTGNGKIRKISPAPASAPKVVRTYTFRYYTQPNSTVLAEVTSPTPNDLYTLFQAASGGLIPQKTVSTHRELDEAWKAVGGTMETSFQPGTIGDGSGPNPPRTAMGPRVSATVVGDGSVLQVKLGWPSQDILDHFKGSDGVQQTVTGWLIREYKLDGQTYVTLLGHQAPWVEPTNVAGTFQGLTITSVQLDKRMIINDTYSGVQTFLSGAMQRLTGQTRAPMDAFWDFWNGYTGSGRYTWQFKTSTGGILHYRSSSSNLTTQSVTFNLPPKEAYDQDQVRGRLEWVFPFADSTKHLMVHSQEYVLINRPFAEPTPPSGGGGGGGGTASVGTETTVNDGAATPAGTATIL